MNKSQRMQLKAFICLLGAGLLLVLFLGKLFLALQNPKPEQEAEQEPVKETKTELFSNVWVLETGTEEIVIFRDGNREEYSYAETFSLQEAIREQLADITVTDGCVTAVSVKTEKINGKILSADDTGIEVEGYGKLPLDTDYKGYRLYDELSMCSIKDICFGYAFTDLVMENGSICGVLLAKEEKMESIRVLLKSADYGGLFQEKLVLTADTAFSVVHGAYHQQVRDTYQAGEEVTIEADSSYFSQGRVWIEPEVLTGKLSLKNVNRNQGIPSYRGRLELLGTADGIIAINEVLLEEYLYSVVPSEMPSKYPPEALAAQAICARSYAYGKMEHAGYPQYGAHLDDSTSYQVYNNILEQESTTTAVKETFGELLFTQEGTVAGTYYYSTSCGVGTEPTVWKTAEAEKITYLSSQTLNKNEKQSGDYLQDEEAFAAFIQNTNDADFERNEGWYRWSYTCEKLKKEHLQEILQKRYQANPQLVLTLAEGVFVSQDIKEIGDIKEITVAKRGKGGVADELLIETTEDTYKVISEHNIRYVLNDGESMVCRQDASTVPSPNLLPSGFFIISTGKENGNVVGYTLTGGGFGHGVGMSQNGAKEMAKAGYTAEEILLYFYEGCYLQNVYQWEGKGGS